MPRSALAGSRKGSAPVPTSPARRSASSAWAASAAGATLVTKEALLQQADVVTLHLVLSDRTRGILGASYLARLKPGALLVNTSRGPLVDEAALIDALQHRRIRAALDVYDREP